MTRTGIVPGVPEAEYHSDPALSSTGARLLLPEYKGSPKKFQYAQSHPRTSRTFDVGHAVHAKVLGVGNGLVEYPAEHLTPSGNVSTKAATLQWETEQRNNDLTPVSPDEATRVDRMAEAVLNHELARPLFEVAVHREVSVFADVDGVPCRARFDAVSGQTRNGVYAVDLKSGDDASPEGMTRSIAKWGYEVQEAHYEDVYAVAAEPINEFAFVFVERDAPFEVGVTVIPEVWMQYARKQAAEARRIYAECIAAGDIVWPGYATEINRPEPPVWLMFDRESRYEQKEINI